MLGALLRKPTALPTCGGAALRQPIHLISSLLAQNRKFSSSYYPNSSVAADDLQNAAISAM
jgi:hypothetical protein